jgi:hypothetical protein
MFSCSVRAWNSLEGSLLSNLAMTCPTLIKFSASNLHAKCKKELSNSRGYNKSSKCLDRRPKTHFVMHNSSGKYQKGPLVVLDVRSKMLK